MRFFLYDTKRSMAIFLRMIAMFLFLSISGCLENKELVDIVFDRETSYNTKSTDVTMLVSDSGITRYKMETKEWYSFEEATDPYWYLPEKIHGVILDSLTFQPEASFDADTAYYYSKKKLWKFINNVKAVNQEGEQFETELLYWDENEGKIWSDQFIRITRGDFVNTGTGFESNQTLSKYRILNATAEIPIQENTPADTINEENAPPP